MVPPFSTIGNLFTKGNCIKILLARRTFSEEFFSILVTYCLLQRPQLRIANEITVKFVPITKVLVDLDNFTIFTNSARVKSYREI